MVGGYWGRILEIDLTSGAIQQTGLPPQDILRRYIGGYGLGLWMLYQRCGPGVSALHPDNPMIFLCGPLVGTRAPAPNNLTLTFKNASTGFTAGRSHTHGFFGPNLRWAGYDGIIVTGRSDRPVYLWVTEDTAELRDASRLWGKDTHDTEDLIKEETGQPRASVAAIGPAGENLCAGALIGNDKNHSFSHGGTGTVMGSKRLKAIAVYGRPKPIPVANKKLAETIGKKWRSSVDYGPASPAAIMKNGGVPRANYVGIKSRYGLCAKNMLTTVLDGFGDGMSDQTIRPRPCYGCSIACSYDVEIGYGPHKGYVATLSGGGEGIEGSAAMVGVSDAGWAFYLTDLYDRLGLESSMVGCAISMAFEAFEKGLLTTKDTDGLELRWGDVDVVEKLIRKYAARDGFGDVLAHGPKKAAEIIGGDASHFAVHVKGSGMNLHDWRRGWGVLLGQIVGTGSGWPAPGADITRPDPDAGYADRQPPQDPTVKPEEVRRTGIVKFAHDCTGVCWLNTWGHQEGTRFTAEMLSAVTGWDLDREELLVLGERIVSLERAFNVRHGLTPEHDYDVPERLTEGQRDGPLAGNPLKPYLNGMISEYYRLMGWDEGTGRPWPTTLSRLGLDFAVKDLWG